MKRFLALLMLCLFISPAACAAPIAMSDMSQVPETNDEGFLPEGADAVYFKDFEGGYWFYLDQSLRLEITRH